MLPEQVTDLLQEARGRARDLKPSACAGTDTRLLEILEALLAAAQANGYAENRLLNLHAGFVEAMQWPMMLGREFCTRVFTRACCPTAGQLAAAA